jgi:GTP-binding protein EngB required for normal cell division
MSGPLGADQLLQVLLSYLEKPEHLLIDQGLSRELRQRTEELLIKIREADDRIIIGLVGGTGVGKSTLINALAGKKISLGSDVRPTTNRLVLYRHRENDFSLTTDEEVRVHDSDGLARVSLADFPDFDSIEKHHREALARHFPKLDLLLWVVDPGKYADRSLYHWLALAPQARVNSLFIFNKIDELEARYGENTGDVLREVIEDFQGKLQHHAGLQQPEIITLSAIKGQQGLSGSNISKLNSRLEELRDRKLRISIKQLNLAAMTEALISDLSASAECNKARQALTQLMEVLDKCEQEIDRHLRLEAHRLTSLYSRPWRTALTSGARGRAPWPLDFILFIWDRVIGLIPNRRKRSDGTIHWPQPDLAPMARRIEIMFAETLFAFGPESSPPKEMLRQRLNQSPSPGDIAETGRTALVQQALDHSRQLTRRYHWRFRHHVLPAFVLVYPFLPMFLSFGLTLLTGRSQESTTTVTVSLGWRDILTVIEVIVGLYVVEAIYFSFSLDNSARKSLDRLIEEWEMRFRRIVRETQFEPARVFSRELAEEIEVVNRLVKHVDEAALRV